MITLEAIKKLKRFLQNARPGIQIFDCSSLDNHPIEKVYDEDGVVVLYSSYWDYFEVYGLLQEQYEDLIEGDFCHMRHFTEAELL